MLRHRGIFSLQFVETEQSNVLTRFAYRINATLERYFPEQRLFLKSDTETRFIRLRPVTQAVAMGIGEIGRAHV